MFSLEYVGRDSTPSSERAVLGCAYEGVVLKLELPE